jgi:hypothetical protein
VRVFFLDAVTMAGIWWFLRWTFNGLVGLSLLLFVASMLCWISSRVLQDSVAMGQYTSPDGESYTFGCSAYGFTLDEIWFLESGLPTKLLGWSRGSLMVATFSGTYLVHREPPSLAGFAICRTRKILIADCRLGRGLTYAVEERGFLIAYWLAGFLSLPLPLVWVWVFCRKRGRAKIGLCAVCSYDLRASKERCPECGTAVEKAAVRTS